MYNLLGGGPPSHVCNVEDSDSLLLLVRFQSSLFGSKHFTVCTSVSFSTNKQHIFRRGGLNKDLPLGIKIYLWELKGTSLLSIKGMFSTIVNLSFHHS